MAAVLESTRSFLYKRRKPLLVVSGLAGGAYLAGKYALDKLRQVQVRMVEERRDKENLRRRFAQNQEDCTFTVLALLPTLGDQLFEKMNVEELTSLLQKTRITQLPPLPAPAPALEPTSASDPAAIESTAAEPAATEPAATEPAATKPAAAEPVKVQLNGEAQAHTGEAHAQNNGHADDAAQDVAENGSADKADRSDSEPPPYELKPAKRDIPEAVSPKTVEDPTPAAPADAQAPAEAGATEPAQAELEPAGKAEDAQAAEEKPQEAEPAQEAERLLPPSGSALDQISEPPPPPISPGARLTPMEPGAPPKPAAAETEAEADAQAAPQREPTPEEILEEKKAKLALWNELKVVAFSRTLTSMYAIVLLTLQTHIQLNLIGRYAYLASVTSLAKPAPYDHKIDVSAGGEEFAFDQSFAQEGLRDRVPSNGDAPPSTDDAGLSHETERVYLTFSWWFLHRGWNVIADRVRDAVEQTFGRLPLKSQLSWAEFDRLLASARRKIEYEVLGEEAVDSSASAIKSSGVSEVSATTRGSKRLLARRLNFLDALFPPTLEDELHVLIAAGTVPPTTSVAAVEADVQLRALLDETKDFIDSRDFRTVLRLCLDQAFAVFKDALKPTFGIEPVAEEEGPRFQELGPDGIIGKKVRLAALFPSVAKQSQLAIHGSPNEYVESLSEIKELRALSAVIYSSWPKP